MKPSELKQLIKEEISNIMNEKRKNEMNNILEEGKKKLEIFKQSMRKKGYDV